jgi:hypothetical protein
MRVSMSSGSLVRIMAFWRRAIVTTTASTTSAVLAEFDRMLHACRHAIGAVFARIYREVCFRVGGAL